MTDLESVLAEEQEHGIDDKQAQGAKADADERTDDADHHPRLAFRSLGRSGLDHRGDRAELMSLDARFIVRMLAGFAFMMQLIAETKAVVGRFAMV